MIDACFGGGASPNFFNAILPFSEISLLLQGFENETPIRTSRMPRRLRVEVISSFIISRAGQPTKVGVIVRVTLSDSSKTSLMIPRSTSERTGISGSFTSSSHSYIVASVTVTALGISDVKRFRENLIKVMFHMLYIVGSQPFQ